MEIKFNHCRIGKYYFVKSIDYNVPEAKGETLSDAIDTLEEYIINSDEYKKKFMIV